MSSSGYGRNVSQGNAAAELIIRDNPELQWAEGYFRTSCSLYLQPSSPAPRLAIAMAALSPSLHPPFPFPLSSLRNPS